MYGIIDQLIWRVPGSEDPQGVALFARVIGAPEDRNLVDWYFDGGLTFTGMFRNRPGDALAIGFAYTNISNQVTAFDVDFGEPVARNYEALIEICYTFEIKPGWSLQPDFQYIFQPGGNVAGARRTQRLWGHAPASASDEGRVHSQNSKSRDRVIESSLKAPSRRARRAWLGGAIAFGAALPLLAGVLQSYGEDADAAMQALLAPTADFSKLEAGRGQAWRRRHLARLDQHRQCLLALLRQYGFQARAQLQDRQRDLPQELGVGSVLDRRLRRARASVQFARLPELPSEGRAGSSAALGRRAGRFRLDAGQAFGSAATDEEKAKLEAHRVNSLPEPTYGGQLQDRSIQGFNAEGKLKIDYSEEKVKLADGETVSLRAPHYSLTDLGYGPISPDVMISPRVAPPMIGLGLLEAVPEEQILALAQSEAAKNDGISGKPNQVWSREHDKVMLGRFGWKAGIPTIAQQAAEAFNGDIGISSTMIPAGSGDCTEKQPDCLNAPSGNSPNYQNVEVGDELFKLVDVLFAEPRRARAAQARRPGSA